MRRLGRLDRVQTRRRARHATHHAPQAQVDLGAQQQGTGGAAGGSRSDEAPRPAGHRGREANGWWNILDDVEAEVEPDDLAAALDEVPAARKSWDAFTPSARKQMLYWVVSAGKETTRQSRIGTIVEQAARGERAKG